MRSVKVTFQDGNQLTTSINGDSDEILSHYLLPGQAFNIGDPHDATKDNVQRAVSVEFLDAHQEGRPTGLNLQRSPGPFLVGYEYDEWPHGSRQAIYGVVVDPAHYRRVVARIKRGGGSNQEKDGKLFAAFKPNHTP